MAYTYKKICTPSRPDDSGAGETRRSRAMLLSEVGAPRAFCGRSESAAPSTCQQRRSDGADTVESCENVKKKLSRKSKSPASIPSDDCPDGGGYAVLDVRPDGEGELVAVVMTRPSDTARAGGVERVTVRLLVEQYAVLSPGRGALTPERADALFCAGRLAEAVCRAASLLQYGDQSGRRLVYKLTARGIDRAIAEEAVAYLADKGLIAEDRGAVRRAEQGARKLWGPRRIREDLRAQGYEREAIEAAMLALEDAEVDFVQNCASVIRRKWGALPTDRVARAKCRAALLRLGYEAGTVREAERRLDDGSF